MFNPCDLKVLHSAIQELQLWMVNNPKYSVEFKHKAAIKDNLYRIINESSK